MACVLAARSDFHEFLYFAGGGVRNHRLFLWGINRESNSTFFPNLYLFFG
jgi:hypothetical protein